MPFYSANRRPYKASPFRAPRRAGYKRKTAPTNYASTVKRVQNPRTGGFLGVELKFHDAKVVDSSLSNSATQADGEQDPTLGDCLNSIDAGTGPSQREGRKILMKSIQVQGVLESTGTSDSIDASTMGMFFVAIVLDTQTNGAQLSSEDVYENVTAHARNAAMPFRNMEFLQRYKVIKMLRMRAPVATVLPDGTNTGSISGFTIPFSLYAKLNVPTNYAAAAGGIGDITDNSLHVLAWSTSSALTPKITYGSRLRFLG